MLKIAGGILFSKGGLRIRNPPPLFFIKEVNFENPFFPTAQDSVTWNQAATDSMENIN